MLLLLIALVGCLVFGAIGYLALFRVGLIPESSGQTRLRGPEQLPADVDPEASEPLRRYGGSRTAGGAVTRMANLPQGCLIAVLVFAALWFVFWGIVLVMALRILTSPY